MKTLLAVIALLLAGLLAVQVYDRVQGRRKAEETRQAEHWKEAKDAYDRCISADDEAYARDGGNAAGEQRRKIWLRARAYCRVNFGESPEEIGKELDAVGVGRQ